MLNVGQHVPQEVPSRWKTEGGERNKVLVGRSFSNVGGRESFETVKLRSGGKEVAGSLNHGKQAF